MCKMLFAPKCVLFFLLFIFTTMDVECDCILSMNDFSQPSPVLIKENKFLSPDLKGHFIIKRSERLTIGCPGNKNFVAVNRTSLGYDSLEATCINNQTFRIDRTFASFKDIKCIKKPTFVTQVENKTCNHGAKLYQIGYKLKSKFYEVYEACFDHELFRTYYTKHELLPSNKYIQPEKRPAFVEGDVFGKIRMSQMYKIDNQKQRIDNTLGANMSDIYISKNQFLTRGHLSPRADFTLSALVRATFHYINAAPQWQRENSGDWRMLEDALRRRVQKLGHPVTIYTGTHGVVSLQGKDKIWQPIYLHTDSNNNGVLGVPLYFYKLVYDATSHSATAFLTINSPYYNTTTIDELVFCPDICSQISWLKWKSDDGFDSFCCSYEDFIAKEPGIKLDVRGLFY